MYGYILIPKPVSKTRIRAEKNLMTVKIKISLMKVTSFCVSYDPIHACLITLEGHVLIIKTFLYIARKNDGCFAPYVRENGFNCIHVNRREFGKTPYKSFKYLKYTSLVGLRCTYCTSTVSFLTVKKSTFIIQTKMCAVTHLMACYNQR